MREKARKRWFALGLVAALFLSVVPAYGTETKPAATYQETFASGVGAAVKSGGASLKQVSGKTFDGNKDGAAVYVSNRANTHDAADFPFVSLGVEDGTAYDIEVTGYVDGDVTLSPGAQVILGTDTTFTWLYHVDMVAGHAFRLTTTFMVNKQENSALRVQTNDVGQAVPFYIGDIRITPNPDATAKAKQPRPPAEPFKAITFEDGTKSRKALSRLGSLGDWPWCFDGDYGRSPIACKKEKKTIDLRSSIRLDANLENLYRSDSQSFWCIMGQCLSSAYI